MSNDTKDDNFTLVECTDHADLLRNKDGSYCWHTYDPEGDPANGEFSQEYPTLEDARASKPSPPTKE